MNHLRIFNVLWAGVLLIFLASCEEQNSYQKEEAILTQWLIDNNITTEPTYTGLYYIEIEAGSGADADGGDRVNVKYTGTFLDGEVFDSGTHEFTLGYGMVIQGWDEGINYMKEGGKAKLIIPSWLGYGATGAGDVPPYTTLVFEVELLDVF